MSMVPGKLQTTQTIPLVDEWLSGFHCLFEILLSESTTHCHWTHSIATVVLELVSEVHSSRTVLIGTPIERSLSQSSRSVVLR